MQVHIEPQQPALDLWICFNQVALVDLFTLCLLLLLWVWNDRQARHLVPRIVRSTLLFNRLHSQPASHSSHCQWTGTAKEHGDCFYGVSMYPLKNSSGVTCPPKPIFQGGIAVLQQMVGRRCAKAQSELQSPFLHRMPFLSLSTSLETLCSLLQWIKFLWCCCLPRWGEWVREVEEENGWSREEAEEDDDDQKIPVEDRKSRKTPPHPLLLLRLSLSPILCQPIYLSKSMNSYLLSAITCVSPRDDVVSLWLCNIFGNLSACTALLYPFLFMIHLDSHLFCALCKLGDLSID